MSAGCSPRGPAPVGMPPAAAQPVAGMGAAAVWLLVVPGHRLRLSCICKAAGKASADSCSLGAS